MTGTEVAGVTNVLNGAGVGDASEGVQPARNTTTNIIVRIGLLESPVRRFSVSRFNKHPYRLVGRFD